jgi:hypothetical protein
VEFAALEENMETAAAILLRAIVDNNTALKSKVSMMNDPKQVEEILKPYYRAALVLVKKVSGEGV